MIGLVTDAVPFATLSFSSQATLLIGSFAVVLSVGTILISLLTRYSLAVVFGILFGTVFVLSLVGSFLPFSLDAYFSVTALAERPQILIVAGVVALGALLLGALVASAVAARTFQPLPSPAVVTGPEPT